MNSSPHQNLPLEESIRRLYNRVEMRACGTASKETQVLAAGNKVVVVARGAPAGALGASPEYEELLRSEFAAEFGCTIQSLRTRVSLSDDEKMEIFTLNRPLQ